MVGEGLGKMEGQGKSILSCLKGGGANVFHDKGEESKKFHQINMQMQ